MTKHAKKSEPLQLVDRRHTATVEGPVPFLGVCASMEHSFFDLCVEAGRQVLDAMMEQDRVALCGPRGQRDPDRRAGRAGTTPSEVTLGDRHFPIVMIDGLILGDHTVLLALGIDTDGKKQVLGLREGTTENRRVAKALLRDLIDRGLDPQRARLFVVDGAKAVQAAIQKVFGALGVMHRCQIHKRRNVLGHLPDHQHARVRAALTEASSLGDAQAAERRLVRLAASLDTDHPGAAASVREGLAETLTLQTLGIGGALYRKLRSTNAIENLNSRVVTDARHVKR